MSQSAEATVIIAPVRDKDAAIKSFLDSLDGQEGFPAFTENVQAVNATSKTSASSARILADIILRDVALTAKVLGVANSVSYNRTADVIVDVSYAVLIMGFDRVRDLALAATVVDHFKQSPGLRELLARSVLIANQNHELARYVGYAQSEEAYLAGMFGGLGEVVAATYRVADYARVQELIRDGRTPEAAPLEVFGLTFREIGVAVAERLRLPDRIVAAMAGAPAAVTDGTGPARRSPADLLAALTDLSGALVAACYQGSVGDVDQAFNRVWRERGRPLNLSEDDLQKATRAALAETRDILRRLKIPLGDLLPRTAAPKSDAAPTGSTAGARQRRPSTAAELDRATEAPELKALCATIRELRGLEGSGRPQQVASLVLRSLEAICEAGYQRAIFALSDGDRTEIRGRLAFGQGAVEVQPIFEVRVSSVGSPFGATLARKADVVLTMDQAGALRQDRLLRQLMPLTFGILPLVVDRILIGCLYFDHPTAVLETQGRLTSLLQDLRDTLVKQLRS